MPVVVFYYGTDFTGMAVKVHIRGTGKTYYSMANSSKPYHYQFELAVGSETDPVYFRLKAGADGFPCEDLR